MIKASSPRSRKYSHMEQPAYGAMNCIGAGLDAGEFTMTVYSIAPASSSERITCATVELFWPMAT